MTVSHTYHESSYGWLTADSHTTSLEKSSTTLQYV